MNATQSAFADGKPAARTRSRRQIDLSGPYEIALATALSLPAVSRNGNQDENITKKFRLLYEAANGRHVTTALGPIAIAPAVAPWLKDAPLSFATREEFSGFVRQLAGRASARTGSISRH